MALRFQVTEGDMFNAAVYVIWFVSFVFVFAKALFVGPLFQCLWSHLHLEMGAKSTYYCQKADAKQNGKLTVATKNRNQKL